MGKDDHTEAIAKINDLLNVKELFFENKLQLGFEFHMRVEN